MRGTFIAVIALATCSTPVLAGAPTVRHIGLHQYMLIDGGNDPYPKATATCAQLGRHLMPMGVPEAEAGIPAGNQFKFECFLDYEVVPLGNGSFKIYGAGYKAPRITDSNVGAIGSPDWRVVASNMDLSARTYCAKLNKVMVVIYQAFDTGPGLFLVFRCGPGTPSNTKQNHDGSTQ